MNYTLARKSAKIDSVEGIKDLLNNNEMNEGMEKLQVSVLVNQYLAAQNLAVLPQKALSRAVEKFVDQNNKTALTE